MLDKKVVRAIIKVIKNEQNVKEYMESLSDITRDNYEIMLAAVKRDGNTLEYASEELKNNLTLVLEALKNDPYAINYVGKKLLNDKKSVVDIVSVSGESFPSLDIKWRRDREVVYAAVNQYPLAILACDDKELLKEKKLALLAIKDNDTDLLEHFDYDLVRSDSELATYFIEANPSSFCELTKELRDNYDLAMIAVSNDPDMFDYVSERLKDNKDLALELVKHDGTLLSDVSKRLRDDKDIAIEALKQDKKCLEFLGENIKQDEDKKKKRKRFNAKDWCFMN